LTGYDVLVTVDQGIPHQQYPAGRKLSIILLRSRTNQLGDLLPLVDAIMQALATIQRPDSRDPIVGHRIAGCETILNVKFGGFANVRHAFGFPAATADQRCLLVP
jgi:hypothetical protein